MSAVAPGAETESEGNEGGDASAGTENTGTAQRGTSSDTVPYSRFKEVNDKLRDLKPFEDLMALGYDVDSLRRLVGWEAEYTQDPGGTIANLVDQSELPAQTKELLSQVLKSGQSAGPANQQASEEQPPGWAKPLIEDREERRRERDAQAQRDVATQRSERLQSIMTKWKAADKDDGLKELPDKQMLSFISGAAGTASDDGDLFETARRDYLEHRDFVLGAAVKPGAGNRSASGGAALTPADPPKAKNMEEASQMAIAMLEKMEQEERGQ